MRYAPVKIKDFINAHEFFCFIRNNGYFIFLSCILLFGMVGGALSVNFIKLETVRKLDLLFSSDFQQRVGQPCTATFISSLSSSFIFMLFIFFSSLSLFGALIIPISILFRGFGLGLTAGYLYLIYELKGIAFYILIIVPGIFISSIGLILLSMISIRFSLKFASKLLPNPGNERLWDEFPGYFKLCGYILTILTISSLVDMVSMLIFSRLFNF